MVHEPRTSAEVSRSFRAVVTSDGRPGPIEERLGRRRLRLVDPDTDEGRRLLQQRRVEWIAPGGVALGRLTPAEALDALRARLEARLADPSQDDDADALRDGLARLKERSTRLGRA